MRKPDLIQVLLSFNSQSSFTLDESQTYDGITWLSKDIQLPSKEEVENRWAELNSEYEFKQYQRDRAPEYPSLQEQLDMQYWDAINGTTTWQDAINAVKTKYPKPTES
jgi:hypothetical protein